MCSFLATRRKYLNRCILRCVLTLWVLAAVAQCVEWWECAVLFSVVYFCVGSLRQSQQSVTRQQLRENWSTDRPFFLPGCFIIIKIHQRPSFHYLQELATWRRHRVYVLSRPLASSSSVHWLLNLLIFSICSSTRLPDGFFHMRPLRLQSNLLSAAVPAMR